MLKAIAFGLAVGAGVQGFRNWPADGPVTTDTAVWLFIGGLCAAYLGGRARRGPTATANASAHAEATAVASNTVNVFTVAAAGPSTVPGGVLIPSEHAPWMGEARPALTLDQVDGMEVSEILDSRDQEMA